MMFLVVLEYMVFRFFIIVSIQKLLDICGIFLIYIFNACNKLKYFLFLCAPVWYLH